MKKHNKVIDLMRYYSSIILSTIRAGQDMAISIEEYTCARNAIQVFLILFDDPDENERDMMEEKLLKKLEQVAQKQKLTKSLWKISEVEQCIFACIREKENPRNTRENSVRETRIDGTKTETEKESVGYFHD